MEPLAFIIIFTMIGHSYNVDNTNPYNCTELISHDKICKEGYCKEKNTYDCGDYIKTEKIKYKV